jgi:hypothetical protein
VLPTTPSNKDGTKNIAEDSRRQSYCASDSTQLERLSLERVIKAVNSELDEPGESGSDTETGSDNESE